MLLKPGVAELVERSGLAQDASLMGILQESQHPAGQFPVNAVAASSRRAMPKSAMTVRVPTRRMLSGFRARCTTPA